MAKFYTSEISEKYYEDYNKDCEIKRPLKVEEASNGVILPLKVINDYKTDEYHLGGVLYENREFCSLSSNKRKGTYYRSLQAGYEIEEKIKYIDETVIYGGVLYEFYGHVLLETMSRLWYYYKSNPNKYRVVFNVVPRARGKFKEFFELLDIPYDDNTFITEPTQYKKVVIPEQASIYAESWHKDFLIPFDYMKAKVKPAKYKKICFSRLKLTRNPVINEKEVIKIFEQNGYKTFSPERLSLKQQISLLKGAESFVCWAGTLACQVLFCENKTERIILNRCFEPAQSHQIFDQCKELQTYTIDCSLNPLPTTHVFGPWLVGFTEELKQFCEDKNFKFNKNKKTNIVSSKYLSPFIKEWVGINKHFNIPIDEFEAAPRKIKKVKFERTFLQNIYKVLSFVTTGEIKQRLNLKSKGEV